MLTNAIVEQINTLRIVTKWDKTRMDFEQMLFKAGIMLYTHVNAICVRR